MKNNIFPAIRLTLVCLVFLVGIYSLLVLGVAQFLANSGKGEIIEHKGKVFYSYFGQSFTEDKYFNSSRQQQVTTPLDLQVVTNGILTQNIWQRFKLELIHFAS